MVKQKDFETYLCIDNDKFKIFLFDTINYKNLYSNELIFNKSFDIKFEELSKFLDNNIFKIEKLLGSFIDDIFIVINDNIESETHLSIKKKNDNNITNQKNLNQALVEAKDLFSETNQDQNIVHMLVNNFIIDDKIRNFFVENLKSDYLHINIKFITLSDKLSSKFDKIFETYQIEIKKFISGKYLKQTTDGNSNEIPEMAHKILNGINPNEISIVPKIRENKGFFEKFFQLFS
tara:strand:+ start:3963 stop:4664 length:702 start_codon:yes stop_codon:yes gene_type:complete